MKARANPKPTAAKEIWLVESIPLRVVPGIWTRAVPLLRGVQPMLAQVRAPALPGSPGQRPNRAVACRMATVFKQLGVASQELVSLVWIAATVPRARSARITPVQFVKAASPTRTVCPVCRNVIQREGTACVA